MKEIILRYDTKKIVSTRLDPLNDVCTWFAGLRSKGYVADILRENHGFHNKSEINKASQSISCHAEYAVNLLNQGFLGLPEVSFLPIYYAFLNVAKIYIIMKGKQTELEKQRWHGASYYGKNSGELMNEQIILHSKGAIPLYYHSITNNTLVVANKKTTVKMKEIYPFILSISHEFSEIYKPKALYYPINIELIEDNKKGFKLKASINTQNNNINKRNIKVLKRFVSVPKVRINRTTQGRVFDLTGYNTYVTSWIKDTKENSMSELIQYVNRYLLTMVETDGTTITITPISNKKTIFPQEFAIILAFFHMSNIVRYNPEMLEQLKDSKAWTILLTLLRHGSLSFLELSWSAIHQKYIKILPSINGV